MFYFSKISPEQTYNITLDDVTLWKGDCLKIMADIPDESIDCILVDLPYGCLKPSNVHAAWDKQLDINLLWKEWLRISKPRTPIILFAQNLFSAQLIMSNPKLYRYSMVWDKVHIGAFLNANRMPLRQHEDILMFYRMLPTYNPQMVKSEKHVRNAKRGKRGTFSQCYGNYKALEPTYADEKYPTSIIPIPKICDFNSTYHPTQKPTQLLEWLIKTYTNPGDTVLDCCMGSGSTMVACINTNRRGIGMELTEKFFAASITRCLQAIYDKNTEPSEQ